MDVEHALTTTRTVRRRLDLARPVERGVVEDCLRLALQAPNGSNMQLWRWVLVDDAQVRAAAADIYRTALDEYASRPGPRPYRRDHDGTSDDALRISGSVMYLREHLHEVPVLVVPAIAGELEGANLFHQASLWGSVLPAVWSFMLALRARGMGSAWTTIHLWRAGEMADLLGIPPGYSQVGLFPIAYTVGDEFRPAVRRPVDEVASWNRFPPAPAP
jgi:nitroreductase